jgi:long-chain acyl-CoA synthetase
MPPVATAAELAAAPPFATLDSLAAGFADRGARTALIAFSRDGVRELSYAELALSITEAAAGLRERGVSRGERVALWAPTSPEWVVAYFAIIMAGGVAVPLDDQSNAEVSRGALSRAAPRLLLTTRTHLAELERNGASDVDCVLLDDSGPRGFAALRSTVPAAQPVPPAASEHVASMLFTSGTTGTPKAVPLTHANLAGNTAALLAARLIAPGDRIVVPLPLHHTYPFTVGLLMPLATGAAVVFPAGLSGPDIVRACTEGRGTALLAVPRLCAALWDSVLAGARARGSLAFALFRLLLSTSRTLRRLTGVRAGKVLFGAVHARIGPSLGLIGCGGAKLSAELAVNLEALGWTVLTGYGLTETSPVLTFNSPRHARLGSEGRPLPGVEVRIATADDPTPDEILARGASVFAGYWQDDESTRKAFTADSWFRTGDLGRFDADGYLYVTGRSKELIVLADGKKLFPEPVEKIYAESPLIEEIGIFERSGSLVALVVPDEEAVRERGALREAASLREELEAVAAGLPPYQRLTAYRFTRAPLPRTQLGKLKRHLLPGLFDAAAQPQVAAVSDSLPPADAALLDSPRGRAAWRWLGERYRDRVLTLDTSPQLELGIDSLEWVTLSVEIEQRFGVALRGEDVRDILTLRDLVKAITTAERAAPTARASVEPPLPPGPLHRALGALLLGAVRLGARIFWPTTVRGAGHLPSTALLLAPNHASYLDAVAIAAALPWERLRNAYWAGWVGIMHNTPLRRLVSRATQVFPVDPDRDLDAALATARALLARGHDVIWFPEGRRSPTGELGRFHAGVGAVLQDGAAAALPTAIRGTFEAWPRGQRLPSPRPLDVDFGTPLSFPPGTPPVEISAALEAAVRKLLAGDDGRSVTTPPHPEQET